MTTPFHLLPVLPAVFVGAAFYVSNAQVPANAAAETLDSFEWIVQVG